VRVGASFQFHSNLFQYGFSFGQYFVVSESQYLETLFLKKPGSHEFLFLLFGVLSAVNFDNEVFFLTGEVGDVWPDHMLATEFESGQVSVTQVAPEFAFSFRLMAA
jgi:hypothetical protein